VVSMVVLSAVPSVVVVVPEQETIEAIKKDKNRTEIVFFFI